MDVPTSLAAGEVCFDTAKPEPQQSGSIGKKRMRTKPPRGTTPRASGALTLALRLVAPLAALALSLGLADEAVAQPKPATVQVPEFEVDPNWPQVPATMLMGDVSGVAVDAHDNVWIINRPGTVRPQGVMAEANPPEAVCCVRAPPVMEFDSSGKYLRGWGGKGEGYDWPVFEHSIHIDYRGNVWLSAAKGDAPGNQNQMLKFTQDGRFLLQIGHVGASKGSLDTDNVNGAADMYVYPKTNEVFVADGYVNRRVIVFDADTGAFKRMWGAYGNRPDDSAPKVYGGYAPGGQQFWTVHGIRVSNDGLVYVADRRNNRVQVFTTDGKFVAERYIERQTKNVGAVFGVAFSPDAEQRFLYVPDASNGKVHILDRKTLKVLSEFGRWGPYAGQFEFVHSIAVDSQGNIYTTEVIHEQRVQKWIYKGLKTVPAPAE